MKYEITVPAKLEQLKTVNEFIVEKLKELKCLSHEQFQVEMAVEEIFVNIVRYAYYPAVGKTTVRLYIDEKAGTVSLQFEDEGTPYNPLTRIDPDITLKTEERGIGGLGIYMTKKCMDSVTYNYKNGKNILIITKRIK